MELSFGFDTKSGIILIHVSIRDGHIIGKIGCVDSVYLASLETRWHVMLVMQWCKMKLKDDMFKHKVGSEYFEWKHL